MGTILAEEHMVNEEEDATTRRYRLARERTLRWKKKQSQEKLAEIRKKNSQSQRNRIERMTPEQVIENRAAKARNQRQRIARMTKEQAINHRLLHARCERNRMKKKNKTELLQTEIRK